MPKFTIERIEDKMFIGSYLFWIALNIVSVGLINIPAFLAWMYSELRIFQNPISDLLIVIILILTACIGFFLVPTVLIFVLISSRTSKASEYMAAIFCFIFYIGWIQIWTNPLNPDLIESFCLIGSSASYACLNKFKITRTD